MATGVFSLRKVYIRQYQNVDNRNFASWPESGSYGYVCGGSIPGYSTLINRLDYSIEITTLPGKNLPAIRGFGAGVSSLSYGYMGGGINPTPTYFSQITRLDFSTETVSEPGKNLPFSRLYNGSVSSNNYGYFSAGANSSLAAISTIARIDYSSETIDQPASRNLPANNAGHSSLISSNYGYFAGGFTPTLICTISRLDFVNDTCTVLSNPTGMPARSYSKGISNVSYGYFGGGYTPGAPNFYFSQISRLDFATEVSSVSSSRNLPVNINPAGTVGNINFGYFCGGETASTPVRTSAVTRLDFSTDILSPTSAGLPTSLLGGMTFSGGQSIDRSSKTYGYSAGGYGPTYINTISRMDFSTENLSLPGKNMPLSIGNYTGANSSNFYGYFGGGYTPNTRVCTIYRFDFSNEIVNARGKNLPDINAEIGCVSSSSYGYFGGGYRVPAPTFYLCTISRLDFSTENVNIIPGQLLGSNRNKMGTVSNNSYGYFGGGYRTPPTATYSYITKLDFSNETTSNLGNNLPSNISQLTATSSNSYGYFVGGNTVCLISRLDFTNETLSLPGKNLPTNRYNISSYSNNFYGYFIGGWFPITSQIDRLDFSTEIVSSPGKNNPTPVSNSATVSNSN